MFFFLTKRRADFHTIATLPLSCVCVCVCVSSILQLEILVSLTSLLYRGTNI